MHHLDDEDDLPSAPSGPHVKAQQHYYEMRKRAELVERQYAVAKDAMMHAKKDLIETMMDMGLTKLDYMDDDSAIHFRGNMNISVTKANEADVRSWLMSQYGDDAEFEDTKLNKTEIRKRIKEDIEAGELSETDVPDVLKLSQFPDIQVRGWKGP